MRRQVEIPDRVFHVTSSSSVTGILSEGLIAGKGKVGRFEDDETHNYVSSDYLVIIDDEAFRGKDLSVLVIHTQGIKEYFTPDSRYDFEDDIFTEDDIQSGLYDQFSWYTDRIIEPNRIMEVIKL